MSTWIIPYIDQAPSFWEEISERFFPNIKAVYGPVPGRLIASGRPVQPDSHIESFFRQSRLPKTVLVNSIVMNEPVRQFAPQIIEQLKNLYECCGVCSVTVASIELAKYIKDTLPNFKITASVLMGISTPAQVLMIQDYVDTIVADCRLIRDLENLKRLKRAFHGEICLIVNEACLPGCPYRIQHFYEMAYGNHFPDSLCQTVLEKRPWLRLTGAWILPQHLYHYRNLYDCLKISGRVTLQNPDHYRRVVGAYINEKSLLPHEIGGGPASVTEPMKLTDAMFTAILKCDKNCDLCRRCEHYYEKAITQVD